MTDTAQEAATRRAARPMILTLHSFLLILAIITFLVAAWGQVWDRLGWIAVGLALLSAGLLV